jgi:hypothetical protein
MDSFSLLVWVLLALGAYLFTKSEQKKRVALLSQYLGKHQIEKLMQSLLDGYLRALDETDVDRRTQIWNMLDAAELSLSEQFARFAADFSEVDAAQARVSKWPLTIPFANQLLPATTFDMRSALSIHAVGIARVVENLRQLKPKDKAYTLSAELLLMQHTCHWFCRSKMRASVRMMARHKTSYEQLLQTVSPETRKAHSELLSNR